MKKLMLLVVAASLGFFPALGCSREASKVEKTTVKTPEGETTVKKETTVEKSGENPPAVPATPGANP